MAGLLRQQLAGIASVPDQKQKMEQYRNILGSLSEPEPLNAFIDHSEKAGSACSRTIWTSGRLSHT